MPHGYCFLWTPSLLSTCVVSDLAIGLPHYPISVTLRVLAKRRQDLPFRRILVLSGVFLIACGTIHLIAALNIRQPIYGIDAAAKAATAAVSLAAAFLIWSMLPKVVALPSPKDLEQARRIAHAGSWGAPAERPRTGPPTCAEFAGAGWRSNRSRGRGRASAWNWARPASRDGESGLRGAAKRIFAATFDARKNFAIIAPSSPN